MSEELYPEANSTGAYRIWSIVVCSYTVASKLKRFLKKRHSVPASKELFLWGFKFGLAITLGLIVIAYLLSLVFLGYVGYKKTTSTSDYLVGGRDMNPIVMSLSYGATFISASAIVGFGGVSAAFGMGIQWLCFLNMLVGVVIALLS